MEHSAGFVVFRRRDGVTEMLILRSRDRRDWGFPKGHLIGRETSDAAARRELTEETGLREIRVIPDFSSVIRYTVRQGEGWVPKEVTYFLGEAAPASAVVLSDEHDESRWAPPAEARALVVHTNLRNVFDAAMAFLERRPEG
ncbi:MAG: NUDIX domain-containing protein [Planctomycetota bacterium]